MDKISCSLSMMYAAFKLLSSRAQGLKTSSRLLHYRFERLELDIFKLISNLKYSEKIKAFVPWRFLFQTLYSTEGILFFQRHRPPPIHTHLILIYFICRSIDNSSIQYASNPSLHGHNFCDTLWDRIPLLKIPDVELVIKQYKENKPRFSPCSPRGMRSHHSSSSHV